MKYFFRGDFIRDIKNRHIYIIFLIIALSMVFILNSNIAEENRKKIIKLNKEVKYLKSRYMHMDSELIKIYSSSEFKDKLNRIGLDTFEYKKKYKIVIDNYKKLSEY